MAEWRSRLAVYFFFFQAEDGIRDLTVTGVQTCALPISGDPEEVAAVWEGAQRGIEGVTPAQLLQCSAEQLLAQRFTEHDLRLFRGSPVRFECRCSQGRVAGLLRALGAEEVRGVLQEQGAVTVTCEFCHRP